MLFLNKSSVVQRRITVYKISAIGESQMLHFFIDLETSAPVKLQP